MSQRFSCMTLLFKPPWINTVKKNNFKSGACLYQKEDTELGIGVVESIERLLILIVLGNFICNFVLFTVTLNMSS